jgi:hypothetical protein
MITIAEIKSALHQQVANTEDKDTLQKVKTFFDSISKGDKRIVAYSSKLKPLTIKEYQAEVEEAMQQYQSGKVITQKEMEKRL